VLDNTPPQNRLRKPHRIADRQAPSHIRALTSLLLPALLVLGACSHLSSGEKAALGGLVVGTYIGSQLPSSDIEQVYYLGVFDPQEQLPPTLYRVRVRGQASALSNTKFASGWVRADLIDSLSTISFQKQGSSFEITKADEQAKALSTGRRLMMFGPEGFREAPKDHRLVIVMGADPDKFFGAVDEALGVVAAATQGAGGAQLERDLFRELSLLQAQRIRLEELRADAAPKVTK
jgi:hypothetical protein